MKKLLLLISMFLVACASVEEKIPDDFIVEFGRIEKVDGLLKVTDHSKEIVWKKGVSEPKFGVFIKNKVKNRYDVGFVILKVADDTVGLKEFSKGGSWRIGPPINKEYEALLTESEKEYSPGDYYFSVLVNSKTIESIKSTIVESKS